MSDTRRHPHGVCMRGPLVSLARDFRAGLLEAGYRRRALRETLTLVAHLSQWLEVNHLEVTNLTTEQLESFFGARRTAGYALISPRSLRPVIKVFAACGAPFAVGSPAPIDAGDTSVIARYKRYLVEVRGLQLPTVVAYAARVSRFLASCGVDRELASLTASDVTRAILAESRGSLSEPRSIS